MRCHALLLASLVLPSCQRSDRAASTTDTTATPAADSSATGVGDSARTPASSDSAQRADSTASR
jgi:hypothetical protein